MPDLDPQKLELLRQRLRGRAISAEMSKLELPDFETPAECEANQKHMLGRFRKHLPASSHWRFLQDCSLGRCGVDPCTEACWFGTYHRRVAAIRTGLPLLAAHPGPKFAVTIVHPQWERAPGELKTLQSRNAAQWLYRRLLNLNIPNLLVIGCFEVSMNRELDGSRHWSGEIQMIISGADRMQLLKIFMIEQRFRRKRPHQKIMDIRRFDSLPRKFAYGQKRFVTMRRAFMSNVTGRQGRFGDPPYSSDWAEVDEWMLSLPLGARIILYGCSRRGINIFPKS